MRGDRCARQRGAAVVGMAVILAVTLAPSTVMAGRAGDVDPTFGSGGKVITEIVARFGDAKILADGSVVAAGSASKDFIVARFRPDGSLDRRFGNSGRSVIDFDGRSDFVEGVLVQPDGRIVLVGTSYDSGAELDPRSDFALARLNADGTLDRSFGTGGKVLTHVRERDIAWQGVLLGDGRVVLYGHSYDEQSRFVLVSYLSDGHLDDSFGKRGVADVPVGAVSGRLTARSDGSLLLAGTVAIDDSGWRYLGLSRFQADGTPDGSLGTGGTVRTDIKVRNAVSATLSSGRVVFAYYTETAPPVNHRFVRLMPDGTLDRSFGSPGKLPVRIPGLYALEVDRDGRLVGAGMVGGGENQTTRFAVARLLANGALDNDSGRGGVAVSGPVGDGLSSVEAVLVPRDGKLIVAGTIGMAGRGHDAWSGTFALVRFLGSTTSPPRTAPTTTLPAIATTSGLGVPPSPSPADSTSPNAGSSEVAAPSDRDGRPNRILPLAAATVAAAVASLLLMRAFGRRRPG